MAPAQEPVRRRTSGNAILCKVCDAGTLHKKKVYRMSGPVALIGWIFLIPSFIGMFLGVLTLGSCAKATSDVASGKLTHEIRLDLEKAGVPSDITSKVMDIKPVAPDEVSGLSTTQKTAVTNAQARMAGVMIGTGVGATGGAIVGGGVVFFSFVGGLLGWILTMKKRVLKCDQCGAIVAAS